MNVIIHNPYVAPERTAKQAINEKMKVLREFYVVDDNNESEIKSLLTQAVEAEPNKNFDIVLDRVAHSLIEKKLDSVQ